MSDLLVSKLLKNENTVEPAATEIITDFLKLFATSTATTHRQVTVSDRPENVVRSWCVADDPVTDVQVTTD